MKDLIFLLFRLRDVVFALVLRKLNRSIRRLLKYFLSIQTCILQILFLDLEFFLLNHCELIRFDFLLGRMANQIFEIIH